jgi:hypothetical protein
VPACWRPYSNPAFPTTGGPGPSAAPIESPGTPDAPRGIALDLTASITITDPDGEVVSAIAVVPGETLEFDVTNTAGFSHNFYIDTEEVLSTTTGDIPDAPGIPEFTEGTQTLTWTVPEDVTSLQFACTVPGHYPTMHGDFIAQSEEG